MTSTVAVIGSDPLGAAAAAAFLDDGCRVRLWAERPSWRHRAVVSAGGYDAPGPAAAAESASLVVLAADPAEPAELTRSQAALSGRRGDGALLSLRAPGAPPEPADGWPARGAGRLSGVVCCPPDRLGSGQATILVRGPRSVFDTHAALLGSLGRTLHVGSGAADRQEIALVGLWYDLNVAVLSALAELDPAAHPAVELQVRAVLDQLPAVRRSRSSGGPVPHDVGLAVHEAALRAVVERRGDVSELARAADAVEAQRRQGGDDDPLVAVADRLRR